MENKRTITTRQQIKINGVVNERIATHIVTGAHGYETLCTSGCNKRYNDSNEVIEDCEILDENKYPVTCSTCHVIWHGTHLFKKAEFNINSDEGKYYATPLLKVNIGNEDPN